MTLPETQELFHAILEGRIRPGDPRVEECFLGTGELTAADRVGIYRDMYVTRVVDALRETFPELAESLGDAFSSLARAYLSAHPSEHHDIGRVGRQLAEYLREFPDPDRPGLPDLAELEWARIEVFFAREVIPARVEVLTAEAGPDPGRAALTFVPALRLLVRDGGGVAVWRRGFEVVHCSLSGDETRALSAAMAGAPLSEVCGHFAEREDPAAAAHGAIGSWFLEGWVAAAGPAQPVQAGGAGGAMTSTHVRNPVLLAAVLLVAGTISACGGGVPGSTETASALSAALEATRHGSTLASGALLGRLASEPGGHGRR